jgi:TP901 family phage tail tape measure protein
MADITYSIAVDAGQAIQSAGKLTNALKHLDSAIDSANKSLGGTNKTLKRDFVHASKEVSSATSLLSNTFDQFQKTFTASMAGIRSSNTEVRQSIRAVNKDFKESNSVLITASAAYDKMFKAADNLEAHLTKLSNQTHITSRDLAQLKKLQSSFDSAKLTATSTSGTATSASAVLNSAGIQRMLDVQTQLRAVNSEINQSVAQFNQLQAETKELTEYSSLLGDVLFDLRHKLEGMQKGTPAYRKLADGVTRLENSYSKLNEAIDANDAKLDSMKKSISLAKTSHANLTNEFARSQNNFEAAATSLAGYTAKTKELTVVESRLAEKVAEVNNKLAIQTAAEKQQNLVASMMYGTVPTKFKQPSIDLTGAAKATGALLTVGKAARSALYGLNAVRIAFNLAFAASGISLGTRTVATFDQTLADLSSTVRDVSIPMVDMNYQMNALKLTMEELGATSRYTTTEAGQGMIYMAQAGLNAAEIVQAASHVLDLAVASNTSLARSSDIVIQTMRTFDIQAADAWKVTDTLAVGAKESVTSIEELAQALKFVGPVAHTMGVQVNTVVAALGTLSDSGLQASMAGTGLRRIISEIVNPTYKARNILEAAGLTMDKLDIQGKGLVEVLRNIKNANLSVGQSFAIWGDRGTPALQTILGNFEEFERKLSKMDFNTMGFRGSANRMRTEREDTLSGQFLAAKSAIQEFIIKFSEYTNSIENGKNILAYFAENLRLFNTDIGTGLHSLAKWGAALIAAGITIQKLNHPVVQLKNGVSSLKAAFNSFISTPRQWAVGIQTMNQFTYGVNSLNAAALASPGIFTKLGNSLSALILKYRAAAVAAALFGKAIGLLASLASGAVAALLAAGITSIITATDRATDAMERLKEVTAMYFKDSAHHGQSAVQVMREYAASLKAVSTSALEVRKVGLQADFNAVAGSLSKENIYGGWYLGNDEMTKLLFGMNAKELTKLYDSEKGRSRIKSMLESYDKMGISGTQYSGKNMTDDMRKRLDSEIERIRTLLVLKEQMLKLEDELNARSETAKRIEAEESALKKLSKTGQDAHKSLLTFSQAMRGMDSKEMASALDKATAKIYELKHQFSTTEANELFASFSKAVPNFAEFFDFEGTTLTTKLKKDWQERIRILAEAQGQLEKTGEVKVDFLKSLGLDDVTVKKTLEYFNQLGKVYRELKEAQVKDKLFKFSANVSVQESITAIGTTAEDVSKKLQEMFSDEDLSKLNIRIENGASSVEMKTEHMSVATALLRANVRDAIDSILKDFGRLNAVNLKKAVEAMKVTKHLPKKLGKDVLSFARQFNLDPNTFDPVTGKWTTGAHGTSEKDLNDLFKHSRSDTSTNRTAKTLRQIANEQEELRLKFQQYIAEVRLGSTAEVDLAKVRLEKQKEINSVMEKAASLGITTKDAEIAKTLKLIEVTYALKEAEASRAAFWEMEMAKSNARLTIGQAYGAANWELQQENLEDQLAQAIANKNRYEEGSVGWIQANAEVEALDAKRNLLPLDAKSAYATTTRDFMGQKGSVAQMREAEAALIDLEVERLRLQQASLQVGSDEYTMLQKQIELKQLAKDKALDQNMFAAIPETLNQMKDQYSEWAMMNGIVTQSFDLLTESVINFITTGKFSFSEFTQQVGQMLIELTTKVMMFKAITSIIPGLGFANGGMANIIGFADGGVTNVKKFASGGMLTGPTLFNSSSGLALAGEAGYEHLMPAARLSNGKWGVYAEGMGGNNNQFVINTNINVEGGSSGNAEDDNKLAATISEKVSQSIKDTVKAELVQQMRAGGLLNSNGNKRW